jgi:hypothetical protein
MALVQRKYEDDLIWQAMREAGLSVEDVHVREVYAFVDDQRPDQEDAVFRVTFEWGAPHAVALQILQRARALEDDAPAAPPSGPSGEDALEI